jgi:putative membrane protein
MAEHAKDNDLPKPAEDPRVRFAAERTLLAWIRTGIGLMGFGFVVARFRLFLREMAEARGVVQARSSGLSLWIGTALVVLGVALILLAAAQHWRIVQRLDRGETYAAPRHSLGLIVSAGLATLGIVLVGYLIVASQ